MKTASYINKFEHSGKLFKITQNCHPFLTKNVLKKSNTKYYTHISKTEFHSHCKIDVIKVAKIFLEMVY